MHENKFLTELKGKMDIRYIIGLFAAINGLIYLQSHEMGMNIVPLTVGLSAAVLAIDKIVKNNLNEH